MMKKCLVALMSMSLLFGAGHLVFADSDGGEASTTVRGSEPRVSVFARLSANFESRMEKLRERLLKERQRLEEKMEKKKEQVEKKFERQTEKLEAKTERTLEKLEHRPPGVHATSTAETPFILEIGAGGRVFMRGFVSANASTTVSTTIGVQSWGGVWNVRIASTTRLLAGATTTPDFLVGDYVGVEGNVSTSTPLTIDATLLRDRTP